MRFSEILDKHFPGAKRLEFHGGGCYVDGRHVPESFWREHLGGEYERAMTFEKQFAKVCRDIATEASPATPNNFTAREVRIMGELYPRWQFEQFGRFGRTRMESGIAFDDFVRSEVGALSESEWERCFTMHHAGKRRKLRGYE